MQRWPQRNKSKEKPTAPSIPALHTVTIGGSKWKKKEEQQGMQLSAARDWDVDDDETRFIVPLGVLHLLLLVTKLAVYATPTSDWHAFASTYTFIDYLWIRY